MKHHKKAFAKYLLLFTALLILTIQQIPVYGSSSASTEPDSSNTCEFSMQTDQIEYKDDNGIVRGIVSFEYPQFKGTSSAIQKINKHLLQKSRKFFKSENAASIQESTESSIAANRFHDYAEPEQYYWKSLCSVSYNKNDIVSIHMSEQWYAGGVRNFYDYGLNYNMKTAKKLTIDDVIPGKAKAKILKAAKKYCGSDTTAYNIIKKTKKYKFFLTDGLVNICYGSYELKHGTSWDMFSVKGKYK